MYLNDLSNKQKLKTTIAQNKVINLKSNRRLKCRNYDEKQAAGQSPISDSRLGSFANDDEVKELHQLQNVWFQPNTVCPPDIRQS